MTAQRFIRPKDFLTGSFELFALKAHHRRLTLRFAIPASLPRVFLDPVVLARVFYCLVDRAIEVTPTGGVTVRVWWTVGRLMIMVEDEGPWVAPMDVAQLVSEASPDPALRLAARLVQSVKGNLAATSEGRQQGVCITLTVPARTLQPVMV
jgi:K+-sensing histidine kinase KdpD